ncbi:Nif3-like dinuclear metal center hexameric protein [Brachybacterium saurashtrense]|uniref:GTP cyclohydrolase 1 type 2 homolog n=1 Tax=Brachybacterium saurashtrense TaxID=556288 RepID=A0A345YMM7_9MICO|nr:Nif3-like dinuclear metal center hexameric protein [Brachybacterium saurashtrense]AXK45179.1 Nif3-like dinuclear metal center hexameric protein [Brachybacterium saurashtrense]RRR22067.1 Nif3-like dinuclear metal center hexameric protein [Brachybacterium saurashtrense]
MSAATGARTVQDVLEVLESAYPLHWAESWDRAGLVLGERDAPVERVLLAVDPTVAVAREAVQHGAQLLITHHPLLLRGASFLPADDGKGAVVTSLLRAGTALWCGHTNVDRSTRGTVGAWLRALALQSPRPLLPGEEQAEAGHGSVRFGLGVVGELPAPTTVGELTETVAALVPATARGILHTGDAQRPVRTVAVCPGAGDSFLDAAAGSGADVYLTSDLRHHPALEHLETAADPAEVPALIDVPHAASEALWLPLAEELLAEALPGLEVRRTAHTTDPWSGRAG